VHKAIMGVQEEKASFAVEDSSNFFFRSTFVNLRNLCSFGLGQEKPVWFEGEATAEENSRYYMLEWRSGE